MRFCSNGKNVENVINMTLFMETQAARASIFYVS